MARDEDKVAQFPVEGGTIEARCQNGRLHLYSKDGELDIHLLGAVNVLQLFEADAAAGQVPSRARAEDATDRLVALSGDLRVAVKTGQLDKALYYRDAVRANLRTVEAFLRVVTT